MQAPVGYLVSTFLLAVCTFFAVAPPRRGTRARRTRSFRLGYLLDELPFVAFYWLAASTGLALSEGATGSWVGRARSPLAAATTVGLAVVAWRATAGPAGGRRRSRRRRSGRAGAAPSTRSWPGVYAGAAARADPVRAFAVRRRSVERVANISYGEAGRWNLLDVYRHRSRPSGCPTLVYLHGGSFRSGRKSREARALLYRLASQGWLCVSANYRLGPAARFPTTWSTSRRRSPGCAPAAPGTAPIRPWCSWPAARPAATSPPTAAPDAERPALPARLRARRHVRHRRHLALRLLRLLRRLAGASSPACVRRAQMRRPSSSRTATATRSCSPRTHEPSSETCARPRRVRSCTPSCPAASTRSISSSRFASRASSTASRRSPPGSARRATAGSPAVTS